MPSIFWLRSVSKSRWILVFQYFELDPIVTGQLKNVAAFILENITEISASTWCFAEEYVHLRDEFCG